MRKMEMGNKYSPWQDPKCEEGNCGAGMGSEGTPLPHPVGLPNPEGEKKQLLQIKSYQQIFFKIVVRLP